MSLDNTAVLFFGVEVYREAAEVWKTSELKKLYGKAYGGQVRLRPSEYVDELAEKLSKEWDLRIASDAFGVNGSHVYFLTIKKEEAYGDLSTTVSLDFLAIDPDQLVVFKAALAKLGITSEPEWKLASGYFA